MLPIPIPFPGPKAASESRLHRLRIRERAENCRPLNLEEAVVSCAALEPGTEKSARGLKSESLSDGLEAAGDGESLKSGMPSLLLSVISSSNPSPSRSTKGVSPGSAVKDGEPKRKISPIRHNKKAVCARKLLINALLPVYGCYKEVYLFSRKDAVPLHLVHLYHTISLKNTIIISFVKKEIGSGGIGFCQEGCVN